jgi:hypothetical protein
VSTVDGDAGMIGRAGGATEPVGVEADFRRVMASITDQSCATHRELDVMEALFPLFLDNIGDQDGEDQVS